MWFQIASSEVFKIWTNFAPKLFLQYFPCSNVFELSTCNEFSLDLSALSHFYLISFLVNSGKSWGINFNFVLYIVSFSYIIPYFVMLIPKEKFTFTFCCSKKKKKNSWNVEMLTSSFKKAFQVCATDSCHEGLLMLWSHIASLFSIDDLQ